MKPNVLLIVLPYNKRPEKESPSTKMNSWPALPYGVLSIATYCKDVANIEILDCNVIHDYMTYLPEILKRFGPEIVGINMTFDNSYAYLSEITSLIGEIIPETVIVMGGAATVPVYDEILKEQAFVDAVCYGEGEIPFRRLCMTKFHYSEFAEQPSWRSRISIFPPRKESAPMDEIIALDYSFVVPDDYYMAPEFSPYAEDIQDQRRFFIVTSKGCPYRCSFCYRSRENDRKMRYASVDAVMDHVSDLVFQYEMNVLTICDDQFMVNKSRAKQILKRLIPYKLRVEFLQGISAAFIDEEIAALMYEAGVRRAALAIESGCQEILDKMVDKPVNLDKAKETIKILRKAGLWVTGLFVMGFPGETSMQRWETISWILDADLDWCTFSPAIPIKGTKLYDICVEGGYIRNDIKLGEMDFSNYSIGPDSEEVAKEIYRMNLLINFVKNRSMRHRDYETAIKSFEQVLKMCPNHAYAQFFKMLCMIHLERDKFYTMTKADPQWQEYVDELLNVGGVYGRNKTALQH